MMVCMAGLQVFIVRFFFQVCCSSAWNICDRADWYSAGREEGLRVKDWTWIESILVGFWECMGCGSPKFSVLLSHDPHERGNRSFNFLSCGKWYIIGLTNVQSADTLNPAKSSEVETNLEL
jgi:hypothetical protein